MVHIDRQSIFIGGKWWPILGGKAPLTRAQPMGWPPPPDCPARPMRALLFTKEWRSIDDTDDARIKERSATIDETDSSRALMTLDFGFWIFIEHVKLRRGLVKLTMCSALGLDERYKKKKKIIEHLKAGWWQQSARGAVLRSCVCANGSITHARPATASVTGLGVYPTGHDGYCSPRHRMPFNQTTGKAAPSTFELDSVPLMVVMRPWYCR